MATGPGRRTSSSRLRVPLLAPLLVLGMLASVVGGSPPPVERVSYSPASHSPASKPFCLVDTHIPDAAYAVEEFARTHNYSPPRGLKGGGPYQDIRHALPALLRPYKEYDVYPSSPDRGRPAPRVVLSDRVPYASWYSADHYDSFLLMFPLDCIPNGTTLLPRQPFGGGGS